MKMDRMKEYAEPLYEYRLRLGTPTEYGASLAAIVSGEAPPPASGLRVDLPFEGEATGRVAGSITGVDYLTVRADGRMQLDLRATITTRDGEKIAFAADGVALPEGERTVTLRENVTLSSASPNWAWVNPLQIWAVGEADMARGDVTVRGYLV
jgi:hypothetical protein